MSQVAPDPSFNQVAIFLAVIFAAVALLATWQVMAWRIVGNKRLAVLKEHTGASGETFLVTPHTAIYQFGALRSKEANRLYGLVALTNKKLVFVKAFGSDAEVPFEDIIDVWRVHEDRHAKNVETHFDWLVVSRTGGGPIEILIGGSSSGNQLKDPGRFDAELRRACGLKGQSEMRES